ncbi:LOW QUALITY PROTEIN: histone-lysine N-methyltransferase SETMAR-like [Tachypleus tridentatus]|uniref:LOW QUALITY PROTEIN: histone-lysine N-methyltransferase SETMAR-like n=1 Tax=Tachypleus tridentatus TaxID=6853 RepID=UPI003FD1D1E9
MSEEKLWPLSIRDISNGKENNPVSFVNEIDDEQLPMFTYTAQNVAGEGADDEGFITTYKGCACNGTKCESTCPCVTRFGENYSAEGTLLFTCHKKPVVECNLLCTCLLSCTNRVVQKGLQCYLQVFKTRKKGFGVRTLHYIPKSHFVCEYSGEVISLEEAKKRIPTIKSMECNYIFVLKEHVKKGEIVHTVIDPTYTGNVGRFINHSCSPNLFMVPVRTHCVLPQLCLFSSRDISPMEELCYNYSSSNLENEECIIESQDLIINRKPCYCNSSMCQSVLPTDPFLFN